MSRNLSVAPNSTDTQITSLDHLVRRLLIEPAVLPIPSGEDVPDLLDRIARTDVVNAIDAATYDRFLNLLPCRYQSRRLFAFGDVAEPLRLFIRRAGGCRCRQLTDDETALFCRLAGISLPW